MANRSGIKIRKANRGKTRKATGTKKGQKVPIKELAAPRPLQQSHDEEARGVRTQCAYREDRREEAMTPTERAQQVLDALDTGCTREEVRADAEVLRWQLEAER